MSHKAIVRRRTHARLPFLLSLMLAPYTVADAATPNAPQVQVRPDGALQWIGAGAQVGVGYDSYQKLRAEMTGVLTESGNSALLGSVWLAKKAGGVKLGYQYQPADQKDASIRKIFSALDQNNQGDRKFTLGAGLEGERWFGTGYASRALTGQREVNLSTVSSMSTVNGVENDRPYIDTITTNTITRTYERAYDYGLGAEVGRVFEAPGVTLSLRLDREWGKESAAQTSLTFGIQKRFTGTPHSLALQASAYSRSGPLESDRHDTRAMLMYRYDFGSNAGYRAARNVQLTPIITETIDTKTSVASETKEVSNKPADKPKTETRLVKTTVTMTGDAFFSVNSSALTDGAKKQLAVLVEALRKNGIEGAIRVVGHTCNLGSDALNVKLSERRAESVRDFLTEAAGMSKNAIQTQGLGKADPKYPNTTTSREKNRRVDIEFISVLSKEETITLPPVEPKQAATDTTKTKPAEPVKTTSIEWKSEVIDEEPAWVRRALRSLPGHKQYVDTYRYARTEQSSTSRREWINRAPTANDDAASVVAGAAIVIPVLSNDTDPDGDAIQIDAIGTPKFGTAKIEGNSVRYTVPTTQTAGADEFTYTVRDAKGAKTSARVRVAISGFNQAPVAVSDSATVAAGASVLIPVLSNDSDPDGDVIQLDSVTAPSVGTAVVENGSIRYAAPAGTPAGDVSFSYTIRDSKGAKTSAAVAVQITVTSKPNTPPIAVADNYYIYSKLINTPVTLDVLANDSDPDGDSLSIISFTQPLNNIGVLARSGNKLILTANRAFESSNFTYTISDGKGGRSTAIVELLDP